MASKSDLPIYSVYEEIANSVTHGVGLILAIAGLAVLNGCASRPGNTWPWPVAPFSRRP